jgi:hypothetical protein
MKVSPSITHLAELDAHCFSSDGMKRELILSKIRRNFPPEILRLSESSPKETKEIACHDLVNFRKYNPGLLTGRISLTHFVSHLLLPNIFYSSYYTNRIRTITLQIDSSRQQRPNPSRSRTSQA